MTHTDVALAPPATDDLFLVMLLKAIARGELVETEADLHRLLEVLELLIAL